MGNIPDSVTAPDDFVRGRCYSLHVMISRYVFILLFTVAQLWCAGFGAPCSASSAMQPSDMKHMGCCGDGCMCTPESCPCAAPAEPSQQDDDAAPAPAPRQQRTDVVATLLRSVIVPEVIVPRAFEAQHDDSQQFPAQRAAQRAMLGVWTT